MKETKGKKDTLGGRIGGHKSDLGTEPKRGRNAHANIHRKPNQETNVGTNLVALGEGKSFPRFGGQAWGPKRKRVKIK